MSGIIPKTLSQRLKPDNLMLNSLSKIIEETFKLVWQIPY